MIQTILCIPFGHGIEAQRTPVSFSVALRAILECDAFNDSWQFNWPAGLGGRHGARRWDGAWPKTAKHSHLEVHCFTWGRVGGGVGSVITLDALSVITLEINRLCTVK
eukprot:COSAG02_NODE_7051_length_3208_cov_2.329045_2_plen_108_part_00